MKLSEFKSPLKVGSSVEIAGWLQSGKGPGDKVIITGFVEGDPRKPYSEDTAPGGWIPEDKIRTIAPPIRAKTYLEIMLTADKGNPFGKQRQPYINRKLTPYFLKGLHLPVEFHELMRVDENTTIINSPAGKFLLEDFTFLSTPILNPEGYDIRLKLDGNMVDADYKPVDKALKETIVEEFKLKYSGQTVNEVIANTLATGGYVLQRKIDHKKHSYVVSTRVNVDQFSFYKDDVCVLEAISKDSIVSLNKR